MLAFLLVFSGYCIAKKSYFYPVHTSEQGLVIVCVCVSVSVCVCVCVPTFYDQRRDLIFFTSNCSDELKIKLAETPVTLCGPSCSAVSASSNYLPF